MILVQIVTFNSFIHMLSLTTLIFVQICIIQEINALKWLSLLHTSSIASINTVELCESLKGLTKRQIQICKKNVEVMDGVRLGADSAVKECQYQFMDRRWNCSTLDGTRIYGKMLNEGTREAAFAYAIASAGLAHAITKQCSAGQLLKCGCDRSIETIDTGGRFQWSGCSDNIAYGTQIAKTFADARDLKAAKNIKAKGHARSLVNLQNNMAGRNIIINNMKIDCKCHGVSGSCVSKTCWRAMPSFREIGNLLKEKFDSATEVRLHTPNIKNGKPVRESKMFPLAPKKNDNGGKPYLIPINPYFKPYSNTDLIYLNSSPDFCEPNEKIGSLGTHGRVCNRTSKAVDGCELMCCGRGYKTRFERVKERCNCKFHWCCYVECNECWRGIEINTCL